MKVTIIKKGRYIVAAAGDQDGQIPVLDFLHDVAADMKSSAVGMEVLFNVYAKDGKNGLPSAVYHEANKSEGIWEFIKGRLRIYYFVDDGALIVLTHGSIKKTQKADKGEVSRAVRLKAQYMKAKENGTLETLELKNGGKYVKH